MVKKAAEVEQDLKTQESSTSSVDAAFDLLGEHGIYHGLSRDYVVEAVVVHVHDGNEVDIETVSDNPEEVWKATHIPVVDVFDVTETKRFFCPKATVTEYRDALADHIAAQEAGEEIREFDLGDVETDDPDKVDDE